MYIYTIDWMEYGCFNECSYCIRQKNPFTSQPTATNNIYTHTQQVDQILGIFCATYNSNQITCKKTLDFVWHLRVLITSQVHKLKKGFTLLNNIMHHMHAQSRQYVLKPKCIKDITVSFLLAKLCKHAKVYTRTELRPPPPKFLKYAMGHIKFFFM